MKITSITSFTETDLVHAYDGDWADSTYWHDNHGFDPAVEYWSYEFYDKNERNRANLTQEIRLSMGSIILGGYFKHFVREVDWEPEKFRNFYTEYSDRIAWGTDQVMSTNTSNQLLWQHSTEIEVLEQSKYRGWQKYFSKREAFGLGLDNNTLNKIFYDTPKAILEKIGR